MKRSINQECQYFSEVRARHRRGETNKKLDGTNTPASKMSEATPPPPFDGNTPAGISNSSSCNTNNDTGSVDLIQKLLDSISASSSSNHRYTRDQIDISSIGALEEILLQQSQQHPERGMTQTPNLDVSMNSNAFPSTTLDTINNSVTSFGIIADGIASTNSHMTAIESNGTTTTNESDLFINHTTSMLDPEQILKMSPVERGMYQQIQHNTMLLRQLQQKIDTASKELHQKLDVMTTILLQQQQQDSPPFSTLSSTTVAARRPKHLQQPQFDVVDTPATNAPLTPPRSSFTTVQQQLKTILWDNPMMMMVRKVFHLYFLYYSLLQRYVRHHREQERLRNNPNQPPNNNNNFDPFMIMKIIFMMAILWSRVQQQPANHQNRQHHRRNENEEDGNDDVTEVIITMNVLYLLLAALALTVFVMVRTGQFRFLYLFYYKYRIPQRVLRQNNQNDDGRTNTMQEDEAPVDNLPNQTDHWITADEIWNEHLLAIHEQEQNPPANGGVVRGAVDGININHNNLIEDWIQQFRHRIEWLLVHDWFRGELVAGVPPPQPPQRAVAVEGRNGQGNEQEENTFTRPPIEAPEERISPISKLVRMVLVMVQDMIIFFVSFVLSILPVWRNIDPEALFNVFQQEHQQVEPPEDEDGNLQQRERLENDGGIPLVQPPIDPAE